MVREGDAASAAFLRLRASLRPPFKKTYPVESVVAPIADSIAARAPRVFLPGFVRGAYWLRNLVNSGPLAREAAKAAPDMRRLFDKQAEDEGARYAAFGPRWGR
jgi:hypothetical protein